MFEMTYFSYLKRNNLCFMNYLAMPSVNSMRNHIELLLIQVCLDIHSLSHQVRNQILLCGFFDIQRISKNSQQLLQLVS